MYWYEGLFIEWDRTIHALVELRKLKLATKVCFFWAGLSTSRGLFFFNADRLDLVSVASKFARGSQSSSIRGFELYPILVLAPPSLCFSCLGGGVFKRFQK